MPAKLKPVPAGHHTVTPYLIVRGADEAINFYEKAFGAKTSTKPIIRPDGRIGHAEMKIGDFVIMIAEEFHDMDVRGPEKFGGSPVSLHVYVENVDNVSRQFVAVGGTVKCPVQDQFYGDRMGTFVDPFGHTWHIATHIEDVAPKDLQRRAEEAMKKTAAHAHA